MSIVQILWVITAIVITVTVFTWLPSLKKILTDLSSENSSVEDKLVQKVDPSPAVATTEQLDEFLVGASGDFKYACVQDKLPLISAMHSYIKYLKDNE